MTTWISFYNLLMDIQKSCMDKRASVRTTKAERNRIWNRKFPKFPNFRIFQGSLCSKFKV